MVKGDRVQIINKNSTMAGMTAIVNSLIESGVYLILEDSHSEPMYFSFREIETVNDLVVGLTPREAVVEYQRRAERGELTK